MIFLRFLQQIKNYQHYLKFIHTAAKFDFKVGVGVSQARPDFDRPEPSLRKNYKPEPGLWLTIGRFS